MNVQTWTGPTLPTNGEPIEIERRIQECLKDWLRLYFTGDPFETDTGSGKVMVEFEEIGEGRILFNQVEWPYQVDPEGGKQDTKPVIHLIQTDRRDDVCNTRGGREWSSRFSFTVQIKVPNCGDTKGRNEWQARRIASQLELLLRGPEAAVLCQKGFSLPEITRGSTPLAASGYQARTMSFRFVYRWTLPSARSCYVTG